MLVALALQAALFQGFFAYAQLVSVPLAVKTPYLNAWTFRNPGSTPLLHSWPNFFIANHILGWEGRVRVDGQPYQWMGGDPSANFSNTVASDITPTKSIFTVAAGPIRFNVTFFTPIEPNDYVRQSMPFSYMYIDDFSSIDSQPHNVQIYSDITAEWVTRTTSNEVVWDTTENDDIVFHNVTRESPQPMVDNDDFAEDGIGYYAMLKRPNLTWQTCASNVCRFWFSETGSLNNTKDTNFRPAQGIATDIWPVFAFSVDLGTLSSGSQPDPIVAAIGLVRDPLVTYTTASSIQNRSGYYLTQYANPGLAITAFLQDFNDTQSRNLQLDDMIMNPANQISPQYAQILAFVTRQIFASMDITVPSDLNGDFNTSDVKIFMKDMGRSTRANPVDVLYAAFPALLYFNSSIAAALIEPLLESQSSPAYPNPYAAPDLGSQYPNVTGNFVSNGTLGIDSSSSLLIMVYSHAVKSGDSSLLQRYYSTLQSWANHLITTTLHPFQGSLTADNMSSVDLSNESLKGILGIYCMGKINEALGVANTTFSDQATQLIQNWKLLAISGNHINSIYNDGDSWGLIYNLFPVIWLNTSLIEGDIINDQAQFYSQQSPGQFGFPLDNTQSDLIYPYWTMWTAATIPSNSTDLRDYMISFIDQHVTNLSDAYTLPMQYSASTGISGPSGLAGRHVPSPTDVAIHGAAFSILALSLQNVDINVDEPKPGSASTSNKFDKKTNVGAISGGIIGGTAVVLIFAFVIFFFKRRSREQTKKNLDAIDPFNLSSYNGYSAVNNETADGGQNPQMRANQRQVGTVVVPNPLTTSLPFGAAPPLTSKQREALGIVPRPEVTSVVSAASTPTHRDPSSTSESGAEELRAEVEQLRREVDNIRHITAEAPPEYI